MGAQEATAELAAYLRGLKARSNQSYKALASGAGAASSTLHRYCSGAKLAPDYRVLQQFAVAAGATEQELRRLRELWDAADAARRVDLTSANSSGSNEAPAAGPTCQEAPEPGDARLSSAPAASPPARAAASPDAWSREPAADRKLAPTPAATSTCPPASSDSTRSAPTGPGSSGESAPRSEPQRAIRIAAGILAAILLIAVGFVARTVWPAAQKSRAEPTDLLFSPACADPISMGEHDQCVEEVQRLLAADGATIAVDSSFGPETLRRVTAFQVLAGLTPKGVVDDATKRALYAHPVALRSWTPARVEWRIRAVFRDEPDRAVAIARCQSLLDPLWVLPNTDGSRNWGVFQISDRRLRDLGGTPRHALDPAWNIWAAHELWRTRGGFTPNWPYCDRAFPAARITPAATP